MFSKTLNQAFCCARPFLKVLRDDRQARGFVVHAQAHSQRRTANAEYKNFRCEKRESQAVLMP